MGNPKNKKGIRNPAPGIRNPPSFEMDYLIWGDTYQ
jgi:hypothetical protein